MLIKQRPNGSFFKGFGHAVPTAIALGGALGVATSAHSEEVAQGAGSIALEEIVVTATRRSESIQDVPMSISAVSQADLEKAGATRVEDVVHMVPGLAYTQNSVGDRKSVV